MKALIDPKLEQYAVDHSSCVDAIFNRLKDYTHEHMEAPQMQVGALEGSFLKVLAKTAAAKRIVEVGTFTGYSALMMASALPKDGQLDTCELREDVAAVARRFFDQSVHGSKITIHTGPASESLKQLQGPYDMAFIDADKSGYIEYFQLIRPMMRPGGLIVADNVLWSGRVLDETSDQSTQAIINFNTFVRGLADLDKVMLTVRDGMFLIVV